jgi:hypothetical protein
MKNLEIRIGAKSPVKMENEIFFDERMARETIERMFEKKEGERFTLREKMIINFAVVKTTKKKVRKVLPPPNLKMKLLVASPLNEYTASVGYCSKGRGKYFEMMDLIWADLLDNASYPALPVSNADWTAEKLLYTTAKSAGKTVIADQHYSNLLLMSRQNGIYVANVCGNDLGVFLSSGYTPINQSRTPKQRMSKGIIKSCKDTRKSCEATITVEKIAGVQFNNICWCLADDIDRVMTQGKGGRGLKLTFVDLPKGTEVLLFTWPTGPLDEGDLSTGFPWLPR